MPSLHRPASHLSLGTALLLTLPAPALAAAPDPGIDWQAEVAARKAKPGKATRPTKRPHEPPRPAAAAPIPEPTAEVTTSEATADIPGSAPAIAAPAATTAAAAPDVAAPPASATAGAPPPPDVAPPPASATAPSPPDVAAPPASATAGAPPPPAVATPRPPRGASTPISRARAELVTGSLLAVGGFAALGVLANGLYVHRISERELARDGAYPPELLAPIERQHDRSETRIAAGAVAGVVGLGLGAALIAAGVRELRVGRRSHARVRVVPTVAGLQRVGLQVNVRF